MRVLLCKALRAAGWDEDAAAALLGGDAGGDLTQKARSRITTFMTNLRARIDAEGDLAARRSLAEEWKGSADAVLAVVAALGTGSAKEPS
jgi:hypothetical protein